MDRILVIEDDAAVRAVICRMLSDAGYALEQAADGHEGMAALARDGFALVITDMVMPRQEGVETIQQIRRLDPHIPIVAMSAVFDTDYSPLDRAKSDGADVTLGKPFTSDELLNAVRTALSRRRGATERG
jgi:DNA-binding response OmpR family regulator